jgi:hypothetical protein
MTVTIIESELRTALESIITDWPIRWPNEPWPPDLNLDLTNGNLPVNPDGSPMPCIEARVIHGLPITAIGGEGHRQARRSGLLKIYCIYPQGIGMVDLTTHIDAIELGLGQKTIMEELSQWQRLWTYPPRTDDNAAAIEAANRFVRTVTVQYQFSYRS